MVSSEGLTDFTPPQKGNMSKMPGKKKSCFQITSVTQAQVAATSIPDDTESLDDPDESRTEDMSSEIFNVSRADLEVCDRSSSEETLNYGGDSQEGQQPNTGPVNGGLSYKSSVTGRLTPHNVGSSMPVSATAQPFVSSSNTVPPVAVSTSVAHTAPSTSCSSRFRVIKLDHGTGEPFRRGRWTCTEFYERDSDSNVNRTVDSIKPAATLDHSTDRDSGLGATNNSIVTSSTFSAHTLENATETGFSVSVGHLAHSHPPDSLQQGYSLPSHIGSGGSAFQPTGYTAASQQPNQAQVNKQPIIPQTFLSNSQNGVHQGAMQQKSPIIPPVTLAQQFAYAAHPTGISSGHSDFHQQHFGSSTQNIASSSVGAPANQVSSPQIIPAGQGTKGQSSDAGSAQGLMLQGGNLQAMPPNLPGNAHQHPVSQTQPSAGLGVASASSIPTTILTHSGGQNVPATVPSATNIPPSGSSQVPSTGGQVQLQGSHRGSTTGLQTEESGQKTDAPSQHSAGAGKDGVKPSISESLSLPTPTVNNLFNIHITMDVDDER